MNNKAMILSMGLAGLAVWLVLTSVSSIQDETRKRYGDEMTVFVAKEDIKEMASLEESMIELKTIPGEFVEPNAIHYSTKVNTESEVFKSDIKSISGAVAIVPIKKGEQISYNKIREPSLRTGLSPQITPGRRAISISVSEQSSVSKLIKPGDRVDLIAVMDGGGKDNKIARTILQDVVLLAVGRHVTNNIPRKIESGGMTGKTTVKSLADFDGFSSVTIEVEPAQAQMLALFSQGSSTLIISLRNGDDTDRANLTAISTMDVAGSRVPASVPNPQGGRP